MNGFNSNVWGPPWWFALHISSFVYRPTLENKVHYRNLIEGLPYYLPCGVCRNHIRTHLQKMPLRARDLKSRETFSRYVWRLHRAVNRSVNRPVGPSYRETVKFYEGLRSQSSRRVRGHCRLSIVPISTPGPTLHVDPQCTI